MEVKKYQLEPMPRLITGVDSQDTIFLLVKIGNGQVGGNSVTSKSKLLAKGDLTQLTYIGKAADLSGNEIEIETNVLDVNAFTNVCVITTTFTNQNNKVLFSKIDNGEAPVNGIANFIAKYIFTFIFVLCIAFLNTNLYAQENTGNITFQSLETPSSPGFILFDQSPASIEKPTTPQGLGLSLLGFQQNGGALEFAPFWLTTHPELTAKTMYQNNFPVLYNFAFSIASTKTDSSNYYAVGLRTRLFQTFGSNQTERLFFLEKQIQNELSKNIDSIDLEKVEILRQEYVGVIEKPIFTVDFAAALGGSSTTNTFDKIELNRWAVWMSLNWRPPKTNDFYVTVLTRYINNKKFENYKPNSELLDVGSRLNYDFSKFSVSLEYLQRINFSDNNSNDFRIAFIGSYKLSENIYLTSTFGKNFAGVNNIIALAGINFGFSKSKINPF